MTGLFVVSLFFAAAAHSASEIARAPAPAWVEDVPLPDAGDATVEKQAGGVACLLSDRQRNEAEKTSYGHWARKFTTPAGVQEGARIAIDFAPDYQKLTLHKLVLHRDGGTIDRLPGARIRLMEREEGMAGHVYNGVMTASVDVEDVRVGDILEYAYSVRGENPVFNGVYSEFVNTTWPVPVVRFQYRLLWPKSRFLSIKTFGREPQHAQSETADALEFKWFGENVPATPYDGDTPAWYVAGGLIQIGGYRDWAEVVEWALQFYSLDAPLPPKILPEVDRLRGRESPRDRIVGALEYVQERFRYLSSAEGVHSHRPYPPEEVVERGYGDCKDKALLLSAMLRALGFVAHPALVSTTDRQEVASRLPTPADFDHVIVAVELDGRTYWLDPTAAHQGGRLDERYVPAYGKALVIRRGEAGLTDVQPSGRKATFLESETTFIVPRYDEAVTMKVRTVHGGREADWQRALLAANDPAQTAKDYLNFTSRQFPGVKGDAPPEFDDRETDNTLTSIESYTIPKFWLPHLQDTANLHAEIFPYLINDVLEPPATRIRTSPLGLSFPKKIRETFVLELPERGDFAPSDFRVNDPAFRYESQVRPEGRTLRITYEYEALADAVPSARVPAYLENLAKARENLGYPLVVPKGLAEGGGMKSATPPVLNWALLVPSILWILVATGGAVAYFRWRPDWHMSTHISMEHVGLTGWLILVGIIVIMRPFSLILMSGGYLGLLDLNVWNKFAVPGQPYYDPFWVPVFLFEIFFGLAAFVFSVLLAVLFFKKRRTFPLLFIIVIGSGALFAVIDLIVAGPLAAKFPQLGITSTVRQVSQAVVQAAVWIPYMLVSKRVRSTFVHGRPTHRARRGHRSQ